MLLILSTSEGNEPEKRQLREPSVQHTHGSQRHARRLLNRLGHGKKICLRL